MALGQWVRALLQPGMGLKRWLILMVVGLLLVALGLAFAMTVPVSPRLHAIARMLTLSQLPPLARGLVFLGLGSALALLAGYRVYRLVVVGVSHGRSQGSVLSTLQWYHRKGRGPRIVAIGGGTGLSTLLRGLKYQTGNLTAIVTVADDGGSSGRLRADLGIPPPGDARSCIVAMAEEEPAMEALFNYRFSGASPLGGHSMGNLLLAALYHLHGGLERRDGFQRALEAAGEILSLSGRVVPVSNEANLVLMGETVSGRRLEGESALGHAGESLRGVAISPPTATISEAAVEAIAFADLIVIGPGSLYTSIIPNFLVQGMRQAMAASPAPKVFVCNVATQAHETDGYGVGEHIGAFREQTGVTATHLLVNSNVEPLPAEWGQVAVSAQSQVEGFQGRVLLADVVDESRRTRHDPAKLASAVLAIARGG